jgi:hypothetical protein
MRPSLVMALALVLAALVGGVGFLLARVVFTPAPIVDPDSAWREAAWPFFRDAWPQGRAFRCDAAHCGEEVMVYARVKRGMCDCVAGVADDEDLERVSDAGLLTPRMTPEGSGEATDIAGLKTRLRHYRLEGGAALAVLAGGRNCNAFVAMATARHDLNPQAMEAVQGLLKTPAMSRWVGKQGG